MRHGAITGSRLLWSTSHLSLTLQTSNLVLTFLVGHGVFQTVSVLAKVSGLLVKVSANLHKWGLASSGKCGHGMVQTVSYIVNECRVSKLYDGGLQRLHSADDVAVNWLEGTTTKALAK